MKKEKIVHLLRPKEHKVWCTPHTPVGGKEITIFPSKATCANCLTVYRSTNTGKRREFAVRHTGRDIEDRYFQSSHPDNIFKD